jgi:Flp pilus assembly protein TadG
MRSLRSERGAVAIEFALVLPILLMLVVGIMDFGRAYNNQISVTHAAREAARSMAVNNDINVAITRAQAASGFLDADQMRFTFAPATCTGTEMMSVNVEYDYKPLTSMVLETMALKGQAAMRCGG